jgi:integrase
MLILKSTNEFKLNGFSYPGFPLLTWEDDMEEIGIDKGMLFIEGHQFLIYECLKRGRVESSETWHTYAKHLCQFMSFCEDNELNWMDIDENAEDEMLIPVYRDLCISEFGLSPTTTNQILRTVIRFYQYAAGRGWIGTLPYTLESVRVASNQQSFLAHTHRNAGVKTSADVMLRTQRSTIKFLSIEEVQTLLKAIKNPILKLMVRFALQTGVRLKELLTMPAYKFHKPDGRETYYRVEITKTKGEQPRTIHIPKRLYEDVWKYKNNKRHELLTTSGIESEHLFLTDKGKEWKIKGGGFAKALKALNLGFSVHPHKLRHTYATHTLKGLQAQKKVNFEPLMYVQERLGHAHITTTMKYLHLINDLMGELGIEYQEQIDAITQEAA